jgi:hypothetical protein
MKITLTERQCELVAALATAARDRCVPRFTPESPVAGITRAMAQGWREYTGLIKLFSNTKALT